MVWLPQRRVPSCAALLVLALASPARSADRAEAPTQGRFAFLTYNVAGLPAFISQSDPVHNIPFIGDLLNLYDVAIVQEDFAYHSELVQRDLHPYRSVPMLPNDKVGIGDGLNLFSRFAFQSFERVTWTACNGKLTEGSDCFAPKGFTLSRHVLGPGATVDLYNVHMDSGGSPGDHAARVVQTEQLLTYLKVKSANHAVIVAGDTNMGRDSEAELGRLLDGAGLVDACRSLGCAEAHRIDRVMYRSSREVELRVSEFAVDARFVRADGQDLSDHKAVGVVFQWTKPGRIRTSS